MGRPSKYSPERVERIVEALRLGATYELAAQYGGISYDTFRSWCARFPAFLEEVKKAESTAVVRWLAKIEKAATKGSWQAAAWKLERRYPETYGRTVQDNRHSGSVEIRVVYDD